jgi:hypothetical protein
MELIWMLVAALAFVLGTFVGVRMADNDYEPVEWGGDQPTLYARRDDDD